MTSSISRIDSRQNVRFKLWRRYSLHPEERNCPWLPVQGWKQISDVARQRNIELLLFAGDAASVSSLLDHSREAVQLPEALLAQLSSVETPQGVLAFFKKPAFQWQDLTRRVIFLDHLQDPGNLGSLFRTAAAAGLFSLVCSPCTVSCFNEKVVRASAGLLFSVPFLQNVSAVELEGRGYQIWSAATDSGPSLFEAELKEPLAFVLGSEGRGINPEALPLSAMPVRIPMQSGVDSLNVAVCGALLMYEMVRRSDHG